VAAGAEVIPVKVCHDEITMMVACYVSCPWLLLLLFLTTLRLNIVFFNVQVLDRNGAGSASGVLAGLDWIASNGKPGDVANLSLGGQPSLSLDAAVIAVARQGIKIILAAGNSASPAEDMSPGRVNADNVYTISAIDMNDRRAVFPTLDRHPLIMQPQVSISDPLGVEVDMRPLAELAWPLRILQAYCSSVIIKWMVE
jgi:Subtilase family